MMFCLGNSNHFAQYESAVTYLQNWTEQYLSLGGIEGIICRLLFGAAMKFLFQCPCCSCFCFMKPQAGKPKKVKDEAAKPKEEAKPKQQKEEAKTD
nr:UPF0329 protein ECU05_1680/ECU11_0050-like [Ipomoea batatas]GMC50814.1 UPF0329 protein ECU05_1680/ECU11_0050-like [Ipomoea batatas]